MNAMKEHGPVKRTDPMRVLVVEDDGIVATDIESSLGEMGFQVAGVVRKGEWAVKAAREHRPELVLMDIRLAGEMDGVEAGSAIFDELDIPVVYLTAYADEETRARVRRTAPFGYVVKPFTDRDLKSAVEIALLRHRMEEELKDERSRLAERVKEQACLYDASRILHDDASPLEDRLQRLVERLPAGWQHPETTVARLQLGEERFVSDGFTPSDHVLRAPIELGGEHRGMIEVHCLEEGRPASPDPFLPEEKRLLDEIAARVADEVERKRVRQRLTRLADIVENTSDFVATARSDGSTLWVNRPGRHMLGISDEVDLEGLPISEFCPDWAARVVMEAGIPGALEQGVWEGETALATRDGEEIPVSQVIVAHGSPGGGVSYYSTIARDISHLKETKRTLSRILDTAAEGILLTDDEGKFEFANPAAERILGLERGEIGERSYRDPRWSICGPEGGPFPEEKLPVARVLRTGESVAGVEHGVERPDGTRIVLSVNANPLTDADGALTGVVASVRDVTERKEIEAQLQRRALHDYLTDLPNRALFGDRLEHALQRSERDGTRLAVLFIDLKRFKVVNDSLGHDAGDKVLEEVARRLTQAVRSPDTVARIGGDEFTVLLEDVTSEAHAVEVAERLVGAFQEPVALDSRDVGMEASIGVAVYGGEETRDLGGSALIRLADAAMYRAKQLPGTRYAVAEPSDEATGGARLERESRLRDAIAEGRIRTVYQPIFSLATGEIRGVEALARWRDPDLGDVSPGVFIPLAEETGLIIPLGARQLEQTCEQLLGDGFADPGTGGVLRLHVNLSARQLEDPDLVERTRRLVQESGFPAGRLCLEITESAAMRKPEVLDQLKDVVGVELAIDDFGTRYSTLSQLRRLNVDALKIDRTFVDGLPEDDKDRAIVETILTLGRTLKLGIVAEGIETERQLRLLRDLDCDEAQGFHLARPCSSDELLELLARERTR